MFDCGDARCAICISDAWIYDIHIAQIYSDARCTFTCMYGERERKRKGGEREKEGEREGERDKK